MSCISEPVSWLRLERYVAGDLDAEQRAPVASHLEACEACAECMAQISEPIDLPVLEVPATVSRLFYWLGGLGAATATAFLVFVFASGPRYDPIGALPGVKGETFVMTLVRERGGATVEDPRAFERGDRFEVQITCTHPSAATLALAVYQDDESSFPLRDQPVACGNRVPLVGAFSIPTGGGALVCAGAPAALREDPPDLSDAACRLIAGP